MIYDIKNLSLEEKIGQMLIVGFEGKKITQRNIDQIQKYKVGGIILYKRNFDSCTLKARIQRIAMFHFKAHIPVLHVVFGHRNH